MAGAAVVIDLTGEDDAAAALQPRAVEFVAERGRVLRVPARTTLASALAQLRAALGLQRFARCQLCVPTGGGWRALSPPLSFAAERLADAPQTAAALNAPVALPLPTEVCACVDEPDRGAERFYTQKHGGRLEYVDQMASWPGASAHQLLARLLGCDLDRALHDALRGAAVVLVSADAAAPLIRPLRGAPAPLPQPGNLTMTVHVVTLTGKRIEVVVCADDTVRTLKRALQATEGCHPSQQRIIFGGLQLQPEQALREAGVTDGTTVHLLLRLRGGCGENFAMVCSPDPQSALTQRPASAPKQPALISLEVAVITTAQHPGHSHVQRAMRVWAATSDGFALRVEALPRLAWEVGSAGGAAAYVWHADALVALMVCLKRLRWPSSVARKVARCAALPPAQWFAGRALAGRTVLSTRSKGRRLMGVTARFQPAAPLPAGRLRVSAPARSGGCDSGPTWPAMAWYVHLAAAEGEACSDDATDDDDAAARTEDGKEDAVARATLLFWNY